MKRAAARVPGGLTAALAAINVYRAATQSIACDEAFSRANVLASRCLRCFSRCTGHHVPHTQFALWLASLSGGGCYFVVVQRVCGRLPGGAWWFPWVCPALAFRMWALDHLLLPLRRLYQRVS